LPAYYQDAPNGSERRLYGRRSAWRDNCYIFVAKSIFIRRLRRQGRQLPADHGWLELHGRLYRPRSEILTGNWTFPQVKPAP
jgi:hypothetical protein